MGQELSSHELFLKGIKESLKMRRIKARKKIYVNFSVLSLISVPGSPRKEQLIKNIGRELETVLMITIGPSDPTRSLYRHSHIGI